MGVAGSVARCAEKYKWGSYGSRYRQLLGSLYRLYSNNESNLVYEYPSPSPILMQSILTSSTRFDEIMRVAQPRL